MPDEDMEMGVDIAQAGLVEDIDIDLDFPIGQLDADMVLEDFDKDLNSDPRDELMIEDDDLHYSMMDAIEIDHNVSTAAANDIEIELGNGTEDIWQHDLVTEENDPAGEIDGLDQPGVERMDDDDDIQTGAWPQPVGSAEGSGDIMPLGDPESFDGGLPLDVSEQHGEVPTESSAPSAGEESAPFEASHDDATDHRPVAIAEVGEGAELNAQKNIAEHEEPEVDTQESTEQPSVAEQGDLAIGHSDPQPVAEDPYLESKTGEPYAVQEAGDPVEPASTDGYHTAPESNDALGQSEAVTLTDGVQDENENEDRSENVIGDEDGSDFAYENQENDWADHSLPVEVHETADDLEAPEDEGGEPYVDAANDQAPPDDDGTQTEFSELGPSYAPSVHSEHGQDLEEAGSRRGSTVNTGDHSVEGGNRDDPIGLTDHYGVYISYGSTDYGLFAKGENDDPNLYFLNDKSALDLPLKDFLASLREVIAEEVSPLDELVMYVDGLGLEFSESTASGFLGKFTFGDLVVLYDKLVQNEGAESSPPIYTYLTVEPNCTQRMRALTESANAGRGLSEVALYRDPSGLEEDRASDLEDADTDISVDEHHHANDDSQYNAQEHHVEGDNMNDGKANDESSVSDEVQAHYAEDSEETAGFNNDRDDDGEDDGNDEADGDEQRTDDSAPGSPLIHQAQESNGDVLQSGVEIRETGDSEFQAASAAPSLHGVNSENTSSTATIDGEERDEINYNSDDGAGDNQDAASGATSQGNTSTTADANAPDHDEITWESDDEDAQEEKNVAAPRDTVQVSPVSRKRDQSEALGDSDDGNGNKRRRS
ncbi:hypothetical protein GGS20DRAFT_6631 [Poronia punctata]|nr:hypothetical protein GGS20DRAFT_6631 [Poronia punctata]